MDIFKVIITDGMDLINKFERHLNRIATALEAKVGAPAADPSPKTPKAAKPPKATAASPAPADSKPADSAQPAAAAVTPTTPPADDDMFSTGAPPAKEITIDELRQMLVKLAGAKGEEIAKNIVKTIGNAARLADVAKDKYQSMVKAIEEASK